MTKPWRQNVAPLMEEVASSLMAHNDRRAIVAVRTMLVYLEKAYASGDVQAGLFLSELRDATNQDRTQRFKFVPGELEELSHDTLR